MRRPKVSFSCTSYSTILVFSPSAIFRQKRSISPQNWHEKWSSITTIWTPSVTYDGGASAYFFYVQWTKMVPHFKKDISNGSDHNNISVCDYWLWLLLRHCFHECLQQPHICTFSLVGHDGTTEYGSATMIIHADEGDERHTIMIHLVCAVKHDHITIILIVPPWLRITPKHASPSSSSPSCPLGPPTSS